MLAYFTDLVFRMIQALDGALPRPRGLKLFRLDCSL
jgi:hypothetical protein